MKNLKKAEIEKKNIAEVRKSNYTYKCHTADQKDLFVLTVTLHCNI